MNQLEFSRPNVVPPNISRLLEMDERVARFLEAEEAGHVQAKPNRQCSAAKQASLQLIAERLERLNADHSSHSDASLKSARMAPCADAVAQTVDRSAAESLAGRTARTSWLRTVLAPILIAAPLCLTFAMVFWLGAMDAPWSRSVPPPDENSMSAAQPTIPPPVLSAPVALEAKANEDVTLPLALKSMDRVPSGSIIVINGLPQGSSLSSGHPHGAKGWSLKPDEIGDLRLDLPNTVGGTARLAIRMVAPSGATISDTATILTMKVDPETNIGVDAINSASAEAQGLDESSQIREAPGTEQRLTNLGAVNAMSGDPVPLPTRRPKQAPNDDVGGSWIKPLVFVNLREAPSSSAEVVGVIAKGTKLRLEGRKRGWIQVTDTATSQSGWIYSNNVATVR